LGFEAEKVKGILGTTEHFGYGEREIEISELETEVDEFEDGDDY
jgi:hypothetical protein